MADHFDPTLLQQLCEQASKETDTQKLLELTKQIGDLLDKKQSARTGEKEIKQTNRRSA
jgi:hypothetical protein